MKKTLFALLLALLATGISAQTPGKNYAFKNGKWYNGKDFTAGDWYVKNGELSKKAPVKIDSVIDLNGRWVVPAMGDAFCSSVAGNSNADFVLKSYFDEGIFYLQMLGNTREGRAALQGKVNQPGAPDALFANGAITCTLGYPFVQIEAPAMGIRNPQVQSQRYADIKTQRKMLGDGYWFIDTKEDIKKHWDKIKAQNPGVLTIYLLDSEKNGGQEGRGLKPDVAKALVKKAHKSGIQVFAFVENVDDVRLAIKIGVNGLANLPGYNWDGAGNPAGFELSDDDLKKLAKKKISVTPLFSHAMSISARPIVQEFHAKTLKRLFDAGVPVAIGSNDPQRTVRGELSYWFLLKELDYAKALKSMCETTPRAIYPKRKIGKIEEGFEANFIVINDNPLENLLKLRAVSFKVKNGQLY